MAVVTLKGAAVSNRDASPKVISNSAIVKGQMNEAAGRITANSGDSIGSKYVLATIPSNARVSQVLLSCDGAATAGAADIGLYRTTLDGGAVVDADFFASAQSLASALANSDVTHESGVFGIEDTELFVWEALGLTEDPNLMYDVALTLTTAINAADDIALKVRYAE